MPWDPEPDDEYDMVDELLWISQNVAAEADDGIMTLDEVYSRGLFDRSLAVNSEGKNFKGQFVIGATRLSGPPSHIARRWHSMAEERDSESQRQRARKKRGTRHYG
jgi:hypothetical protein